MRKQKSHARLVAAFVLPLTLLASWFALPARYRRAMEPTAFAAAKTFTVNVTGDGVDANIGDGICATASGNCSLRAAIQEANAIAGTDNIYFNISGTGVKTISPGSPLPDITSAVYIDGYTQTGASQNTLPNGNNAVLTIELNGLNSGSAFGLKVVAGGCTVRGLVIHSFSEGQISLTTNGGNAIEGNFIGTNAAGTAQGFCNGLPGAATDGIDIFTANNTIGGTTAAVRNIISGNCGTGIEIASGNTNNILGNFIGTNFTGTVDVGNDFGGIYVLSSNNNIGGDAAGAGNVISGNGNASFVANGITLAGQSKSNVMQGNLIGTDVNGTVALPNTGQGVLLMNDASNNIIGGTVAGAGNLISGNAKNGLEISADFGPILKATGNIVQGNFIGTVIYGVPGLGNGEDGIAILQASSNTIGGTAAGARNLISGNGGRGIELVGENCSSNLVQGNFIGVDVYGNSSIGNLQSGVFINSGAKNNTIGGTDVAARNIISGNHQRGVEIADSGTTGNLVLGNFIGVAANGTDPCANNLSGVLISGGAANNTIGGLQVNTIAFNGDRGIRIAGSASTGNLISNNSIFSNSDIGIDLGNDGVTPNDAGDADTGPNNLQNFPVLTSAVTDGSRTTMSVALDSTPSTPFAIQFFANSSCDPSGNGEGQTFLGTLFATTLANGHLNASANLIAVPAGQFVTATATDPSNNTSEFSQCVQVTQVSLPGLSINDVTVTEGNSGTTDAVFTVSLSAASSNTVNVSYAASDITATAGVDYLAPSGILSFSPGVTSRTVTVQVIGDTQVESTEDFAVNLSSPVNATLVRATGIGRITNDDSQAALQFSSATYSVNENGGTATITVTRANDTSVAATVNYATNNGTATAGADYTATSGTLSFASGDTFKTFSIPITNDSLNEPNETVNLTLSNVTGNAALGTLSTAVLTIIDDDPLPGLSINDVSMAEGNSGTTNANFTVTLSAASGQTVTVNYATANGAATAGSDYVATSGTLTFAPGQTTKTVTVTVNGDTTNEPDETFFVDIISPTNATITRSRGTGTILNDDAVPTTIQFSASLYVVGEADPRVNLTVTRSGNTSGAASVGFATNDAAGLTNCNVFNGIASPRCDFINTIGTMTFAAGETSKSFSVAIIDDSYAEGTENFTVSLNNPSGATLGTQSTTTVMIVDNETTTGPNPIDGTDFFVRQQYLDFLGREPDPPGLAGWTSTINNCSGDTTQCDRIHVSQLFFQSAEFQDRGYFVYRFYPVAFGRKPDYAEFVPDLASVSGFLDANQLEAAKVAFIAAFMARPAFANTYNSLTNQQYLDALLNTAGVTLSSRQSLIDGLNNSTMTRGQVLRQIVESTEVSNKYNHQAYAVMEYFGYLRRQPDAFYLAWIDVLNSTNDPRGMVTGFVNSAEYRQRFGP